MTKLTEFEEEILRFESKWHTYNGAKDTAIRETFGLSAAQYFQVLTRLLDSHAAYAHNPVLIKRLRRIREDRQSSRAQARIPR